MADRPRVLRVIARLNVGGPAQHAVLVSAAMSERYPTLLVFGTISAGEVEMAWASNEREIRTERIAELGRGLALWADLVAFVKLYRLFRRFRPDIVHTHTAKAGALGRTAAWLAHVPVRVHTFHGHVFRGYFGTIQSGLVIAVERLLARITTRIIAISARQANELGHYLRVGHERIAVVPLGLELERFTAIDQAGARYRFREALGVGDRDAVIAMVGRLTAIKNQALAIRAVARLHQRRRRVILALVGGGEDERKLRELATHLGIADHVKFAGWWHDLAAVYYGSDVVLLTSDNEGTPVCLIEALACGRPIVATDVGGVADVLENGALGQLVPPRDEEALVQALDRTLALEVHPSASDTAAERIRRQYSVARLARDLAGLYDGLLSNHAS